MPGRGAGGGEGRQAECEPRHPEVRRCAGRGPLLVTGLHWVPPPPGPQGPEHRLRPQGSPAPGLAGVRQPSPDETLPAPVAQLRFARAPCRRLPPRGAWPPLSPPFWGCGSALPSHRPPGRSPVYTLSRGAEKQPEKSPPRWRLQTRSSGEWRRSEGIYFFN